MMTNVVDNSSAVSDGAPAQRVVVLGGTGEVGEGIVRRLVQRGAAVAVPARSPQRLDELAERLGRPPALVRVSRVLAGDEDWAAAAEEAEESLGGIDAVVASLGGWWSGPAVIDTPAAEWDRVLGEGLGAHVRAARAFLPRLRTGGAYVLINGSGAEHAVPGSGPVSVSAAAQLMLARVLAAESASGPQRERVRVHALIVATPVRTRSRPHGQPGWVSADDVGDAVTALIDRSGSGSVAQRLVAPGRVEVAR